jgi:hypothetical protein
MSDHIIPSSTITMMTASTVKDFSNSLGRHRSLLCAQGWSAEVLFPEPISPRRGSMKGGLSFVRMSDNHVGFNRPTNPAVIASLRTWIKQEQTIQDQVTLETTKPGVYRVTGNIE